MKYRLHVGSTRGGKKAQGRYGGEGDTVRSTKLFSLPPPKNLNSPCDRRQGDLRVYVEHGSRPDVPQLPDYPAPSRQGEILNGQHARKPRLSSLGGMNCLASLLQSRTIKPQHQSLTYTPRGNFHSFIFLTCIC